MKKISVILMLVSLAYQGWTQEIYSHQLSSAPDSARYEIVQSERGGRYTFKIDKYAGTVFQITETRNQDLAWESIIFLEELTEVELTPDKVNFQIFLSGLGARYIFLLHIHTGKTWQLAEDTESGLLFWITFE